jgi:hypothetical protein
MSDTFHLQLEKIITLSQKILLELSNDLKIIDTESEGINTEKLLQSSAERDKLITLCFNELQSEHYNQHLPLINLIVELDNQLTKQAEKNKLTLKTDLLKIKKNQKATQSYNKY